MGRLGRFALARVPGTLAPCPDRSHAMDPRSLATNARAASTALTYREAAAAPELRSIVVSYWELSVAHACTHRVFPDGCSSIVYRRNAFGSGSMLRVSGPRLVSLSIATQSGDRYWGARIAAPACALLLCHDPRKLVDCVVSASELLENAERLQRCLDAADSFEGAIRVYHAYFCERGITTNSIDGRVAEAAALIEASEGQAKVSALAARIGMSSRQLQRIFRDCSGLTPKQFSRARRLRAVAIGLGDAEHGGTSATWVERAVAMGFADQAHLTRELSAMTGRSPVTFAADIAAIEHGRLVR